MSQQPTRKLDPIARFGNDFVTLCRDAARVRRYHRVMVLSGMGVVWIVALLLAGVTAWRAYSNYREDRILRDGGRTTGRVLSVRGSGVVTTGRESPQVRYTYTVDGTNYERQRDVSGRVASMYQTGSPIEILYNRSTPGASLPANTDPAGPVAFLLMLVPLGLITTLAILLRRRLQLAAQRRALRQVVRVLVARAGAAPLRSVIEVVGALSDIPTKKQGLLADAFLSTPDVLANACGIADQNVLQFFETTSRDNDVGHALEQIDYANSVILLDTDPAMAAPQPPPTVVDFDPNSQNSAEATIAYLVSQHRQLSRETHLRVAADRIDRPTASRHLASVARVLLSHIDQRIRDLYRSSGSPSQRARTDAQAQRHVRAHGLEPTATGLVPTHIDPDPATSENSDLADETRHMRPGPEMLLFVQRALYAAYLQPWDWRRSHGIAVRARTSGDQTCVVHVGFDEDMLFEIRVAHD